MQFIETPIRPLIKQRNSTGWLAVTPPRSRICIAVLGNTEGEARERFSAAMSRWIENLANEVERPNLPPWSGYL